MNKKKLKDRIHKLKESKKPSNIKKWLKVFPNLTEEEQAELDGKTIDEFMDDDVVREISDGVYDDDLEAFERGLRNEKDVKGNRERIR